MKPVYSKVRAMTLAGAVVTILVGTARMAWGIEFTQEMVAAGVVLVGFITGYVVPETVGRR